MPLRFLKGIGARLGCGFAVIVVLTLVLGIAAIVEMNTLADVAIKMHNHPLAVSNAVGNVRVNIMAMHRSMKVSGFWAISTMSKWLTKHSLTGNLSGKK